MQKMNDDRLLLVTSSPHLRTTTETKHIMRDVLIALIPISIAAVILFGFRALTLILVCMITTISSEFIYQKLMKYPISVQDGSAAVTGLLLALTLPSTAPYWIAMIGCVFSIIVVKQLFGGLGKNFANPAIVGRIVLLISFPTQLTAATPTRFEQVLDGATYATPFELGWIPNAVYPTKLEMLLGVRGGAIGETCIVALLIGFVYLLVRKILTVTIPVSYVGSVFLLSWAMGKDPVFEIMAGGLILAAIFMATDYVTSPTTEMGKLIYGIGAGIVTVVIRQYSSYPEGVSFAILLMNILTPHIEKLTRIRAFGEVKSHE